MPFLFDIAPDWNMVVIDVAIAWVVVALPRFLQVRWIVTSGIYTTDELEAADLRQRNTIDPVRHTSIAGTLLAPALLSLLGLPALCWGKPIEDLPRSRPIPNLGFQVSMAPLVMYALQSLLFVVLAALLVYIYPAGAPVSTRAAELCMRMALLTLLPIPLLDSGDAWFFFLGRPNPKFLLWIAGLGLLGAIYGTGAIWDLQQLATRNVDTLRTLLPF